MAHTALSGTPDKATLASVKLTRLLRRIHTQDATWARCPIARMNCETPCAPKNAAAASARETIPPKGRHIRKTPMPTAKTEMSILDQKPRTAPGKDRGAKPTMPTIKKSQPTKMSTAKVAITGSAIATSPSTAMIKPWISNKTQWLWIASWTACIAGSCAGELIL